MSLCNIRFFDQSFEDVLSYTSFNITHSLNLNSPIKVENFDYTLDVEYTISNIQNFLLFLGFSFQNKGNLINFHLLIAQLRDSF